MEYLPIVTKNAVDSFAEHGSEGKETFQDRYVSNYFDGNDPLALMKAVTPIRVLLGFGVLLGGLLGYFLPFSAFLAVSSLLLLPSFCLATLQSMKLIRNPHMERVIHDRMTARIDGDFCVLLIGARCNSEWKLTLNFRDVGQAFVSMIEQLESQPLESSGFMGAENFVSTNMKRSSHVLTVIYWRSYEHLLKFAHDRNMKHAPAWAALNKVLKQSPEIGIWHEAYQVTGGKYDSIYVNCPPMGLGMCGSLVQAVGHLRTSRGRSGTPGKSSEDVPAV